MPVLVTGYGCSSYKKRGGPLHLKDMFEMPEVMEDFVQNYKITVFDIAFLPDGTIKKFKSMFKHVVHSFKYRRFPDEYKPLGKKIEHLEVFLDLLEVFTGDTKYAEIKDGLLSRQKEGDEVTMCSIVEKFTNEGIKQGIGQNCKQIILNMHKKGGNAETISDLSGIHIEIVNNTI